MVSTKASTKASTPIHLWIHPVEADKVGFYLIRGRQHEDEEATYCNIHLDSLFLEETTSGNQTDVEIDGSTF
jgi:hypothetical protein